MSINIWTNPTTTTKLMKFSMGKIHPIQQHRQILNHDQNWQRQVLRSIHRHGYHR